MDIIVTGITGHVGCSIVPHLMKVNGHRVRGICRNPPSDEAKPFLEGVEIVHADLEDAAGIAGAFANFGDSPTIIHLGANSDMYSNHVQSWANQRYTVNVLDAAEAVQARLVVLASSNHAAGGYEEIEPYRSIVAGAFDHVDPTTIPMILPTDTFPDGPYGAAKVWEEGWAQWWSFKKRIPSICVRIGTLKRHDSPDNVRHLSTLLTRRDACRFFQGLVDVGPEMVDEVTKSLIVWAVSKNFLRFWQLPTHESFAPYLPQDDALTMFAHQLAQ